MYPFSFRCRLSIFPPSLSAISVLLCRSLIPLPAVVSLIEHQPDQNAVDTTIPYQIGAVAFTFIQLVGIVAVMSQVVWQVFIVFIPVIATCIWYQNYYIGTAQELSRLNGVCKAPVIQHFSESLSGSTTITSFDQNKKFMKINFHLSDQFSQLKFHTAATME